MSKAGEYRAVSVSFGETVGEIKNRNCLRSLFWYSLNKEQEKL